MWWCVVNSPVTLVTVNVALFWEWLKNVTYVILLYTIPFSLKPMHFTERNAYLCIRHQNVILKLRTFKSSDVKISVNPDIVGKLFPDSHESFLESTSAESIAYFCKEKDWHSRQKRNRTGPSKKRWCKKKVIQKKLSKNLMNSGNMFNALKNQQKLFCRVHTCLFKWTLPKIINNLPRMKYNQHTEIPRM